MLFSYGVYSSWHLTDQSAPPLPRDPGAGNPWAPRFGHGVGAPPVEAREKQLPAELPGASWAVLAFAPADVLWADWLYRSLHGHPVPAGMIDSVTSQGFARQDCVSVFPDRRDPQHAARYPQALEKSGYLVVVCSPDSAHCPQVDARICAFKNAGGEGRIIALLVEGAPEDGLENAPKSAAPDWLPAWLRWRVAGDTLAPADPGEPLIVDARPGRASLKEVRDLLLSALLEVEPWELEVAGFLNRPVEGLAAQPSPAAAPTRARQPEPAPTPRPPHEAAAPGKIHPVILTAAICVSVTLAVAWWAFGRPEKHPAPSLASPLRSTARPAPASITASLAAPESAPPAESSPQPEKPVAHAPAPVAPAPAIAAVVPVASAPAAPAPAPAVPASPGPRPGMIATSQISAIRPAPPVAPPTSPAAFVPPAPAAAAIAPDVRNDMSVLHRCGDMALERRLFDEALAYYEKAVATVGTAGQSASPDYRTEAALLCRKLGTLQLQMSSTSEARDTFLQGRKILLQIKKEGHWNASRARVLAEIETSLRHLPRD